MKCPKRSYIPTLNGEGYNIIITETATVVLFYGHATDGQRLWLVSESMAGAPAIGETATLQHSFFNSKIAVVALTG